MDGKSNLATRQALYSKFMGNRALSQQLLGIQDKIIIANQIPLRINDPLWRNGREQNGHNKLGCMLVELREFIRAKEKTILLP
ncbi:NADAR family protein [Rickettsiales endosymbiont of Stachyamoeba lipophora]|uniref:hypothetical protein n=1 Tax=Rickettsiales endosymbiont of Stachyamoeba lipophora TaxID=2486578 RepID=UPI000F64D846|nr:hypothetical protein [Rickettsiales endosymbiont of Stachyamoeba lipophora]